MHSIGVVAIGRNEGERLVRCLQSLQAQLPPSMPVVYVDSGSTDNSIQAAEDLGVSVVQLDMSVPFTMARGRNTGFQYLLEHHPDLDFVQFIDGDCELIAGWLDKALTFITQDDSLAIVCGRRKERYPEASPYNQLADMEWNTLVGQTNACGGDALMRVSAIREVNGYNPKLIAGEEPEMCIRLRERGWKIWRMEADMTMHDAAIYRFGQWWKRSVRGGWAVADGFARHGSPPESYMQKEFRSGWICGLLLPAIAFGLAYFTSGLSLLLLFGYLILGWKIYRYRRETYEDSPQHARLYAIYCTISKFPQMVGQLRHGLNRLSKKDAQLIEYKEDASTQSAPS